jgi:hypothetical protein
LLVFLHVRTVLGHIGWLLLDHNNGWRRRRWRLLVAATIFLIAIAALPLTDPFERGEMVGLE